MLIGGVKGTLGAEITSEARYARRPCQAERLPTQQVSAQGAAITGLPSYHHR